MNKFTKKQEDVLNYICKHIHTTGFSPSIREIGSALGLSSPATVKHYLQKLVDHDLITVEEGKTRSISLKGNWLRQYHVPVVEDWENTVLSFPSPPKSLEPWVKDFLIYQDQGEHGTRLALQMSGDYLQHRGILSGDYLILGKLQSNSTNSDSLYLASYQDKSYWGTVVEDSFQVAQVTNDQSQCPETLALDTVTLIGALVGVERRYV